jgi:hypothetical protein
MYRIHLVQYGVADSDEYENEILRSVKGGEYLA